jgi:hypothetical protein
MHERNVKVVNPWLLVELGGSSTQTVQRDEAGRFWFSPGLAREPGRPVALACPGLIRDGHVLYATNLGWPDDADPAHELGLQSTAILENDARAAGLGESVLRSGETPALDLIYVNLGTGVGDAQVINGVVSHLDLAHHHVGGDLYCTGCRAVGCLNAYLCSQNLPTLLTAEDCAFVARTLASALKDMSVDERMPLVLGGGIARRYPIIAAILDDLIPNPTELTAAPAEAKSAAYAGLDYLSRLHIMT